MITAPASSAHASFVGLGVCVIVGVLVFVGVMVTVGVVVADGVMPGAGFSGISVWVLVMVAVDNTAIFVEMDDPLLGWQPDKIIPASIREKIPIAI